MSIFAVDELAVSDRCPARLRKIILGMASREESENVLPSYAKCLQAEEFFVLSGEDFLHFSKDLRQVIAGCSGKIFQVRCRKDNDFRHRFMLSNLLPGDWKPINP